MTREELIATLARMLRDAESYEVEFTMDPPDEYAFGIIGTPTPRRAVVVTIRATPKAPKAKPKRRPVASAKKPR
jgi:hypothetical protein